MVISPKITRPSAESNRQLRMLFDNTNEHAICMLGSTGRIISWNMSAERLVGHTSKDVLGKNYSMFFSKEEIRQKVSKKALAIARKKGQFAAEGIRIRKDGTHFWARSYITLVDREGKKNSPFFVLVTQDITGERAQEQKRDEYIGIASHELKNPITTLSLYAELLAQRLELESDKKNLRMLRDIQDQTARLGDLVDHLLTVSKIEGGALELHMETFDPDTFVRTLVKGFQRSVSTHRIVCAGVFPHQVRADKVRIRQVLINLLTNAVKYSPRADKILVHIDRRRNKCVISIHDSGPGIAKKDQRDIFTRFFRAHDSEVGDIAGAGLGLYISKEIIKKHNERLWVESVQGRGTTFSFTLPLMR